MSDAGRNDPSPIPPPPGELGEWLSLYLFPYRELPENIKEDVGPWFAQFTGKSPAQVKDSLKEEWESLECCGLSSFAETLLKYQPIGILHSKYPAWFCNAWLVLSRCPANEEIAREVSRGVNLGCMCFLAPPYKGPLPKEVKPDDTLTHFFLKFGKLRISPPFSAGFFYHVPMWPAVGDPEEFERCRGAKWENASAIFANETGDELLISRTKELGWLSHETSKITEIEGSFEEVLISIVAAPWW